MAESKLLMCMSSAVLTWKKYQVWILRTICHMALFVVKIVMTIFFIVLDIFLALTTAWTKNIAIVQAITLVRTSWRANPVICDVVCRCLLYDCKMWCSRELYVPYRFTAGVSGWIVIWGSSHELCFYCVPYRCKIEQPDTLQHNGIANSEMEMCMWK